MGTLIVLIGTEMNRQTLERWKWFWPPDHRKSSRCLRPYRYTEFVSNERACIRWRPVQSATKARPVQGISPEIRNEQDGKPKRKPLSRFEIWTIVLGSIGILVRAHCRCHLVAKWLRRYFGRNSQQTPNCEFCRRRQCQCHCSKERPWSLAKELLSQTFTAILRKRNNVINRARFNGHQHAGNIPTKRS